jgi:hypothetical protein
MAAVEDHDAKGPVMIKDVTTTIPLSQPRPFSVKTVPNALSLPVSPGAQHDRLACGIFGNKDIDSCCCPGCRQEWLWLEWEGGRRISDNVTPEGRREAANPITP